ncbi:MAG: hypothetical protein ACOYOF_18600 [Verrucomicrobiaceae bacterium]
MSVLFGTLAAFASFAVIAALLQVTAGGKPLDVTSADRLKKKDEVAKEQAALLEKYGLLGDPSAVFAKAEAHLKSRKVTTTTQVVPGSATALKQAAPVVPSAPLAPAAAPAPVSNPQ